jgi:hypothetical protein
MKGEENVGYLGIYGKRILKWITKTKCDGTYSTRQYEDRNKTGLYDSVNKIWAARKGGRFATS